MKYIIRVTTLHTNYSLRAETNPVEGCSRLVDHHLDARTDSALQVQTLLNVCAV